MCSCINKKHISMSWQLAVTSVRIFWIQQLLYEILFFLFQKIYFLSTSFESHSDHLTLWIDHLTLWIQQSAVAFSGSVCRIEKYYVILIAFDHLDISQHLHVLCSFINY
ncbi:hypothetical protein ACJX0J_041387 [Zea mays]